MTQIFFHFLSIFNFFLYHILIYFRVAATIIKIFYCFISCNFSLFLCLSHDCLNSHAFNRHNETTRTTIFPHTMMPWRNVRAFAGPCLLRCGISACGINCPIKQRLQHAVICGHCCCCKMSVICVVECIFVEC